jgi:hypothetical protein
MNCVSISLSFLQMKNRFLLSETFIVFKTDKKPFFLLHGASWHYQLKCTALVPRMAGTRNINTGK